MPSRRTDGPKVRTLRQAAGHRQVDFAQLAGVSAGYLREIEAGRYDPSPVVLHRIATVLGVGIDDISEPFEPAATAGVA